MVKRQDALPNVIPNTFSALRHPNYRMWFWGQMISMFGYWMQSTAQAYLIFELTRSPVFLGYIGFCTGAPAWPFMLYAGVVADRASRRTLLVISQSAMMMLAFVMAALTFTGEIEPWHILVLTMLTGTANAFDAPARHAFVSEMVDPADLTNAIALNSVLFHVGTAFGPAAGGILYAWAGPGWCFTINGITFLAVLAALSAMKLKEQARPPVRSAAHEALEGIRYALAHPVIRTLLIIAAIVSFFGTSLFSLVPAWSVEILHGDARTNGFLQTGRGLGALLGALTVASLQHRRERFYLAGLAAFPILLLVFTFTASLPPAIVLLVGAGASILFIFTLTNSFIQQQVQPNLRGRVMSIYMLTFFGLVPLGSLYAGYLADYAGVAAAVRVNGVVLLITAVVMLTAVRKRIVNQ